MYRRVLIAIDGSNSSNTAAVVAARLGLIGAETRITLLGVLELDLVERLVKRPSEAEFQTKVQRFEREALFPIKETLEEMTGAEIETAVVNGPTADFIVGFGQRIDADLVVVGRRDRSLFEWLTSPSVSKKVLASREHTLLVVPQDAPGLRDGPLRVLLPFDFSDAAERALEEVKRLAGDEAEALDVELLYSVPPLNTPAIGFAEPVANAAAVQSFEAARRKARDEARDRLSHRAAGLSEGGLQTTISVVEGGAEGICDAACEHRRDLIVLTARDRSLLERLFHGDTAAAVARTSEAPVLIVPEPELCESPS